MKKWVIQHLILCLPVFLLIVGCRSREKSFIPVTGNIPAAPAEVEQARDNILGYMISSSRLPNIPPIADWQLDEQKPLKGQYHFLSGNWLMVVWTADSQDENQHVIIRNKADHTVWCGYVAPDGHVIDTSFTR